MAKETLNIICKRYDVKTGPNADRSEEMPPIRFECWYRRLGVLHYRALLRLEIQHSLMREYFVMFVWNGIDNL